MVSAVGLILALVAAVMTYPWLPDLPVFPVQPHPALFQLLHQRRAFRNLDRARRLFFDQTFSGSRLPEGLVASVRWLGDHTFSLYLYHFPLLFFIAAVVPFDRGNVVSGGALILLTLALVFGLSLFTESRRPWWRKCFAAIWDGVAARLPSSRKRVGAG